LVQVEASLVQSRMRSDARDASPARSVVRHGGCWVSSQLHARTTVGVRVRRHHDQARARSPPIELPALGDAEPTSPATSSDETAVDTSWFEATIVDVAGRPVSGLDVTFSAAGDTKRATTNGAGGVRFVGVPASIGSLRIVSVQAAKDALSERPPAPPIPDEAKADDVAARLAVGDDDLVASLHAETPRTIVLTIPLERIRLIGMHFDTNKAFLRETAMRGIRRVVQVYEENPTGKLLIVGHTDTVADDPYNLDLSVERAESVKAYLENDVEAWEAWFDEDKPKRSAGAIPRSTT
jgi:hypothetical protein